MNLTPAIAVLVGWLTLADVTLVLAVALLAAAAARSAATRHAVLLAALGVVGMTPALLVAGRMGAQRWGPPRHTDSPPRLLAPSQLLEIHLPILSATPPQPGLASPAPPSAPLPAVASVQQLRGFGNWLACTWILGVAIGVARLFRGLLWIRQLRRSARPMPADRLSTLLQQANLPAGGPLPAIAISDAAAVPLLIGIRRPMILIPQSVLDTLSADQLLHVVLHESAHAARHDVAVGLYQRVLAIALWFHPLVHGANRRLDLAREELCDNAVLRGGQRPASYVRTLLAVAQSLSAGSPLAPAGYGLAPALIRTRPRLSNRVAGLLNPRRSTMMRLQNWKRAILGINVALGAAVIGGLGAGPATAGVGTEAAAPAGAATGGAATDKVADPTDVPRPPDSQLSHPVPFVGMEDMFGRSQIGDALIITAVHGTTDRIAIGGVYRIDGAYTLASHDEAELSTSITVTKLPEPHLPPIAGHSCPIHRGSGTFTLYMKVGYAGYPHVSMNPIDGGESCGGEYFGTGDFVAPESWRVRTRTAESSPAETPAASLDLSHSVPFVGVQNVFGRNLPGDAIVITAVHGTADTIAIGNTYQIEGSYTLASHDDAELAAFGTATQPKEPHRKMIPGQSVMIHRGSGTFVLRLKVEDPQCPHVSFYPAGGGEGFGGEYFGTGAFLPPANWSAK